MPDGDFEATPDVQERGTVLSFDIDAPFLAEPDFDEAGLHTRIGEVDADFGSVLIRVETGESSLSPDGTGREGNLRRAILSLQFHSTVTRADWQRSRRTELSL